MSGLCCLAVVLFQSVPRRLHVGVVCITQGGRSLLRTSYHTRRRFVLGLNWRRFTLGLMIPLVAVLLPLLSSVAWRSNAVFSLVPMALDNLVPCSSLCLLFASRGNAV